MESRLPINSESIRKPFKLAPFKYSPYAPIKSWWGYDKDKKLHDYEMDRYDESINAPPYKAPRECEPRIQTCQTGGQFDSLHPSTHIHSHATLNQQAIALEYAKISSHLRKMLSNIIHGILPNVHEALMSTGGVYEGFRDLVTEKLESEAGISGLKKARVELKMMGDLDPSLLQKLNISEVLTPEFNALNEDIDELIKRQQALAKGVQDLNPQHLRGILARLNTLIGRVQTMIQTGKVGSPGTIVSEIMNDLKQ